MNWETNYHLNFLSDTDFNSDSCSLSDPFICCALTVLAVCPVNNYY